MATVHTTTGFRVVILLLSVLASSANRCPTNLPADKFTVVSGNYCFRFHVYQKRYYNEARDMCRGEGGTLAMVKSQDIQNHVTNQLTNVFGYREPVWIGLTDRERKGAFKWEDGTAMSWNYFIQKRYSMFGSKKNCVAINPRNSFRWGVHGCDKNYWSFFEKSEPKAFICQFKIIPPPTTTTTRATTARPTTTTTVKPSTRLLTTLSTTLTAKSKSTTISDLTSTLTTSTLKPRPTTATPSTNTPFSTVTMNIQRTTPTSLQSQKTTSPSVPVPLTSTASTDQSDDSNVTPDTIDSTQAPFSTVDISTWHSKTTALQSHKTTPLLLLSSTANKDQWKDSTVQITVSSTSIPYSVQSNNPKMTTLWQSLTSTTNWPGTSKDSTVSPIIPQTTASSSSTPYRPSLQSNNPKMTTLWQHLTSITNRPDPSNDPSTTATPMASSPMQSTNPPNHSVTSSSSPGQHWASTTSNAHKDHITTADPSVRNTSRSSFSNQPIDHVVSTTSSSGYTERHSTISTISQGISLTSTISSGQSSPGMSTIWQSSSPTSKSMTTQESTTPPNTPGQSSLSTTCPPFDCQIVCVLDPYKIDPISGCKLCACDE